MWSKDLIDYFKYFKLVRIMLSIDNTKEQFEFQRYPAKWKKHMKHLKNLCISEMRFVSSRDIT